MSPSTFSSFEKDETGSKPPRIEGQPLKIVQHITSYDSCVLEITGISDAPGFGMIRPEH